MSLIEIGFLIWRQGGCIPLRVMMLSNSMLSNSTTPWLVFVLHYWMRVCNVPCLIMCYNNCHTRIEFAMVMLWREKRENWNRSLTMGMSRYRCDYRLFILVCRLCTVQECPGKISDDLLIQFYWTPTWLFVDSPGQTVQDFRPFVGCAKIIQRTKPSDSSQFEQSWKMTPLFLEFCPGDFLAKK
jgi:hypothetical protein